MCCPKVLTADLIDGLMELIRRNAGSTPLGAMSGRHCGDATRADYTADILAGSIENESVEAVGIVEGESVCGALLWEKLEWDSKILGRSCARIIFFAGDHPEEILSFWKGRAAALGIEYVTMRVAGSGRHGEVNQEFIESHGFDGIERFVFLRGSTEAAAPSHDVVQATEVDIEDICSIAVSAFEFDRFHAEDLFTKRDADRIYTEWVRNSFSGRADRVLSVRGARGGIAGFCTCLLPADAAGLPGWIDLLAVGTGSRRRGFGRSLMLAALGYFRSKDVRICALSTQEHNHPAMALYESLDFEIFDRAVTYRMVL